LEPNQSDQRKRNGRRNENAALAGWEYLRGFINRPLAKVQNLPGMNGDKLGFGLINKRSSLFISGELALWALQIFQMILMQEV
jgi:hypothetical protein